MVTFEACVTTWFRLSDVICQEYCAYAAAALDQDSKGGWSEQKNRPRIIVEIVSN